MMKKKVLSVLIAQLLVLFCVIPASSADYNAIFTVGTAEGYPCDTVSLTVDIETKKAVNVFGFNNLDYDESALEFIGFSDFGTIVTDSIFGALGADEKKGALAVGYGSAQIFKGRLCSVIFRIKEGAPSGNYEIAMTPVARMGSSDVGVYSSTGRVTVKGASFIPGDHRHELIHASGKPATCCEFGIVEHWVCTGCYKCFADENGDVELRRIDIDKDPDRHSGGTQLSGQVEPQQGKTGYTGDLYCLGCGKVITKGHIVSFEDEEVDPGDTEFVFKDVSEADSYYEAVKYVYEHDIFKGVASDRFAPESTMTRAMFVTILGRIERVDGTQYLESKFTDVESGSWYAGYVTWANSFGIVKGYNADRFGPGDDVTVEQAVAIIARYSRYLGNSTVSETSLSSFRDSSEVSEWALEDMKWAVASGVYSGDENRLDPKKNAPRSLIAEMIYGFLERSR